MPEVVSSMISYAQQREAEAGDGLQVLPGVKELLQLLQSPSDPTTEDRIIVGLVCENRACRPCCSSGTLPCCCFSVDLLAPVFIVYCCVNVLMTR